MGCLLEKLKDSPKNNGKRCLEELNKIDMLLEEMVNKYERRREKLDDDIKIGIRNKETKTVLLQKLKQRKIVIHYMGKCRDRINTIMQKRFQIEQLNLTIMQVHALKETAGVFKDFNRKNDLSKIEELNDTMQELTDQVMDINETLGSEPLIDIDEDDLWNELESFEDKPSPVSIIEMPTVYPHSEANPIESPETTTTHPLEAQPSVCS